MYNIIKKIVPKSFVNKVLKIRYNKILKSIKNNDLKKQKIFIFGVPEHGNLGDQAIIDAEIKFIEEKFPLVSIIEIPFRMFYFYFDELNEIITDDDIVCITGGGYLGNLWKEAEDFVRNVVSKFSNNKIIVFPQTVYYEDGMEEREYLEESIDIFNTHKNLTLTAREKKSYNFFKKNYPNATTLLTPDIVLYINEVETNSNRSGVLFCLRKDREKILDNSSINKYLKDIQKMRLDYSFTDTVIQKIVTNNNRNKELQKKYDEFRNAEVIITDRLHGMIMAVITGTPCIAINNKTDKVKGVYQWIKKLNYVYLLETESNFEEILSELLEENSINLIEMDMQSKFEPLVEEFKKII